MAALEDDRKIIIIGAGIIGLNVAWALAQRGYGKHVMVVAEHLPGDLSINYTSPWAGANFSAISGSTPNALHWDRISYPLLLEMADDPSFPYVKRTKSFEYWDEMPAQAKINSMASYLKDYQVLPTPSLFKGVVFGITFTTVTINAPAHTAHLKSILEKRSVQFRRRHLPSLNSTLSIFPQASLVFNCIGGAAETLPGVQDTTAYPTRGQILLARVPGLSTNIMRHGRDYETYIIPRPNSGDQVVLGGYMEKEVRTGDVFVEQSESIKQRTRALAAGLLGDEIEILGAFAGLRPSRKEGARVEREELGSTQTVIHNYGAGGTGFQAGMGMALDAVALASPELDKLRSRSML